MPSKLIPALLLAAFMPAAAAFGDPTFTTRYLSFDDINGDGVLSCGDVVTIGVFYKTDAPPADPTELHGFITMPETDSQGLSFLSGSVTTDFMFTTGCSAVVLEGNNSGDSHARLEATCTEDPVVLPGGATLAVKYQAIYTSPSFPQFTDTATFLFDQRPPGPDASLHATETRSTSGTCSAPPPTVTIKKTSTGPATPGSPHIYSLTIDNLSSLPLGGFYARETVPTNSTFDVANSSPGWVCTMGGAGGACSYLFSSLNPGQTTITYSVLVASIIPPSVINITNTACVAESRTVYGCSSISDPFSGGPTLSISKAVSSGTPATPGGVVGFQIDVKNNSSYGTSDVVVTDTLPPGTSYSSSGSSSSWTCVGSTCTAHLGALAAAQSQRLFLALKVPSPLPAGGSNFVNTACATPAENNTSVCSTATFGASGTPILNLKKTLSQGDGTPGTDLAFDLAVRNDGNQDATGVTITETFPTHTYPHLAASEPGWTCGPSTCSFSLGTLNAGAQRTVRFTVTIESPLAAGVTAFVNAACPAATGAVTACDSVSVPPKGQVSLQVTKTIVTSGKRQVKVLAGTLIEYLISVKNDGNQNAAAVSLNETVPAYTTFEAGSSDAWICGSGGGPLDTCSISIGPLAAGSSASRRFAVRVENPPPNTNIRNTACAADTSGATGCGEVTTDPDTPTTISADLSAALATDNDSSNDVTPGDVLKYTVLISNTGTAPAGSVTFQINAPEHTTLIAGTVTSTAGSVSTGNAPGASTVAVALRNLQPGAQATITYQVTIAPDLPTAIDSIVSQGSAMSTTAAAVLSNDPATPTPVDPTVTPVRHLLQPPPPPPANVPTLGELGLVLLAVLLGVAALLFIRHRTA
jgi:uncharacterized repeat protein (TIGR01451 family)